MSTASSPQGQVLNERRPQRRRLPDERRSITHKFSVAGFDGYVTVGMHEDGTPGEMFVTIAKEGSTISGLVDAWAIMVSIALQYGVPLEDVVRKLKGMSFDPQGYTQNPEIRFAKSIVDYIVRWLEARFINRVENRLKVVEIRARESADGQQPASKSGDGGSTPPSPAMSPGFRVIPAQNLTEPNVEGPICVDCGSIMVPSGRCHRCPNCGGTSGCS